MRFLLLALAALAAAVGVGLAITAWPGVVAIGVGDRVVRLSLALFVLIVVPGAFLLVWLLRQGWRLITFRARFRRWRELRRQRLDQQDLVQGLLALAAGDHVRAERLLGRGNGRSTLHYLAAAQAAHALQAPQRRDALLLLANPRTPDEAVALAVRRAGMQLDDGDTEGAAVTLAGLPDKLATQPQVLELRHRLLAQSGQLEALGALVPSLRRQKVYPLAQLGDLEANLAERLLAQCATDAAALGRVWSGLTRKTREHPAVVGAYARGLVQAGAQPMAEEVLRKALAQQWNPALVALYGELDAAVVKAALARAEHWLSAHAEDPVLLLALARLCHSAQLWGKARSYLEEVLARQPSPAAYRLLAQVYEALGEAALAQEQRNKGLECAVLGATVPARVASVVE